jgi:DNA-binding transcriptional LysR family regulator
VLTDCPPLLALAIDPRDLLVFSAVVRDGGFSAAGRGLGSSKQAVSERVARLEAALGVRLFERTTRQVRLTDAGAIYADRVASIIAQLSEANREVRSMSVEATGTLTVSCPVVFGRRVLVPVCVALRKRYPALLVEARLSDRQVRLIEEGFDVVVRVGPLEDSALQVKRLGTVRRVLVASRAFVKQNGRPRQAKALEGAACLTARRGERWRIRGQLVTPRPALTLDDLEALADAAVQGVGIAYLPELICAAELASGRLVELLEDSQAPRTQVHALLAPGRYRPPKVRVFLDALSAALR